MYLLNNTLRPYAWGYFTAMADLFGREPSRPALAEHWFRAPPRGRRRAWCRRFPRPTPWTS